MSCEKCHFILCLYCNALRMSFYFLLPIITNQYNVVKISSIPGIKRSRYLEENVKAADVDLSAEDIADIEHLLKKYPNAGDRYNEREFKFVGK